MKFFRSTEYSLSCSCRRRAEDHIFKSKEDNKDAPAYLFRPISSVIDPILTLLPSKVIQTLPSTFGVLDIHFSPQNKAILAVASSTGRVIFYELITGSTESDPHITHIETIKVTEDDIIVTSVAWNPTIPDQLVITLTNGEVGALIVPSPILEGSGDTRPIAKHLEEEVELNVLFHHSLEAWTTFVLPREWPFSGFLSGGDDAVLAYSALPHEEHKDSFVNALVPWSNRRIHSAGVTAILPLTIKADKLHVYLTGSYDDHLRILSVPGSPKVTNQRQPQVLHERNLEGGVWRLKLIRARTTQTSEGSRYSAIVLVSCMYAGTKIVELFVSLDAEEGHGSWDSAIVANFTEHESMCYACDVQAEKNDDTMRTIISCSFYDKRLCLWRWNDRG